MTFSSELEARFAELLTHYPEGRHRGALIPMLMYAQDEIGAITPDLMAELAKRLGISVLQVDEVVGYYSTSSSENLPEDCVCLWPTPSFRLACS